MGKKLDYQQAKDGQTRLQAMLNVGGEFVASPYGTHVMMNGECLCGTKAKLFRTEHMTDAEMPPMCGRCENRLEKLVQEEMRRLTRECWTKPVTYGGDKHFAPRSRPGTTGVRQIEQLSLDAELLPIGSGKLLGHGE